MSASTRRTRVAPRPRASTVRGALDGLGQGGVDLGVGGVLAQVALLGPLEVPPRQQDQPGHPEQQRAGDPPADQERGRAGQHGGDQRDHPLGQGPAHRPAELVDVAGGPGQQVAAPGGLHHARPAARASSRRSPRGGRPGPPRRAPTNAAVRSGSARSATTRAAAMAIASTSMWPTVVPCCTDSTISPSSRGATSPAAAAAPCSSRVITIAARVTPCQAREVAAHLRGGGDREGGVGRAHGCTSTSRVTTDR